MKISFSFISLCLFAFLGAPSFAVDNGKVSIAKLDRNLAAQDQGADLSWHDAARLGLEGKGWSDTEKPYHRLPARVRRVVPENVWTLGRHSAGLCLRFVSNAPKIGARWTVSSSNIAMPHMAATGVSGLDLYVHDSEVWRWTGGGRPTGVTSQAILAKGIPAGDHEYLLYLPLYNGVETLEIGVPADATLAPAPPRPADHAKPIVFYGTSITQGGCASRPGMAHTAILGRKLNRPVINLGFSGNGKMEPALEVLLAELDPSVYVLDCVPNMTPAMVSERVVPFVTALRCAKPGRHPDRAGGEYCLSGRSLPARSANGLP